jgi:hypothetical protein
MFRLPDMIVLKPIPARCACLINFASDTGARGKRDDYAHTV